MKKRGQNTCTRKPYGTDVQARLALRTAARNRNRNTNVQPREPRFCTACQAWHLVPAIRHD